MIVNNGKTFSRSRILILCIEDKIYNCH